MAVYGRADLGHAEDLLSAAERIYWDWDAALSNRDVSGLIALYAPDAILESPLIPLLLGAREGICRGHDELRRLFEAMVRERPVSNSLSRQFHRGGFFSDGRTLIWEYPHATSNGKQMDFVEVMEIEDGFIQHHRVYWGWFSLDLANQASSKARAGSEPDS